MCSPPHPLPPPVVRPASPGSLIDPIQRVVARWITGAYPLRDNPFQSHLAGLAKNQVAWLGQMLVQPHPDLPGSAFASTAASMSASFIVRSLRSPGSREPRGPGDFEAAFSATGQRKCLAVVTCSLLPDIHSVVPVLVNLERTPTTLDCVDICPGSAEKSLSQGMRAFIL